MKSLAISDWTLEHGKKHLASGNDVSERPGDSTNGCDSVDGVVGVNSDCPSNKIQSAFCQRSISDVGAQRFRSQRNTIADVAVIELGASPLEPYNGDVAFEELKASVKCIVLCASDPYAVYGVMKSFKLKPDLVSGIATNTLAGAELIEKLCGVKAINLINPNTSDALKQILADKLKMDL